MEYLSNSLLYSIQMIPGETREEKFKEIGRIVKNIISATTINIDKNPAIILKYIKDQNIPKPLIPLIKVLVGVKIKNDLFIIESFQTNDSYIIEQAFHARWFFDGSLKNVTNFEYFKSNIFNDVSLKTRRKIIKKLSICLTDNLIAEDFFNGLTLMYGPNESMEILPACSSDFIYNNVVKYKIILTCGLLTTLYKKYPDFVVKYIKFSIQDKKDDFTSWTMYKTLSTIDYSTFLPLLVKNNPDVFINAQDAYPNNITLGTRRTRLFLKNGKNILIKNPQDVINKMPLKLINKLLTIDEFEELFGNLFPERWDLCNLNEILNYLEYYPENKRADLIIKKFNDNYGYNLFDKIKIITPNFLMLLEKNQRYELVKKVIDGNIDISLISTETSWWCYLPLNEALESIKQKLLSTWQADKKKKLLYHLVFVCKINNSKESLIDVLNFIDDNFDNENSDILCYTIDYIKQEFDLNTFDLNYWTPLFNIIKKIKMKKDSARDYWVLIKILKSYVHYCFKNSLPAGEIIDEIIKLFLDGRIGISWNLLDDEPQYELIYLQACFQNDYWLTMSNKKNILQGINRYNIRHYGQKHNDNWLSLKNFPVLINILENYVKFENKDDNFTKELLKKLEPVLYDKWFPNDDNNHDDNIDNSMDIDLETPMDVTCELVIDDKIDNDNNKIKKKVIYISEAIIALKNNYKIVTDNWLDYYECCKKDLNKTKRRRVKKFLKSLIWYSEIPIKFVEKSLDDNNFDILGYLLDEKTFNKLIMNYLPRTMNDEKDSPKNFINPVNASYIIRKSCKYVPNEIIDNYLNKREMYEYRNYINGGLSLWTYSSYRMPSNEINELIKKLIIDNKNNNNILFLKKHSIRLISLLSNIDDKIDFYNYMWLNNFKQPLIKEILGNKIGDLFFTIPCNKSWLLYEKCLNDVTIKECKIFEALIGIGYVSSEYINNYTNLILDKLKKFIDNGLNRNLINQLLKTLIINLKKDNTNYNLINENIFIDIFNIYENILNSKLPMPETINHNVPLLSMEKFILKVYLNVNNSNYNNRVIFFNNFMIKEIKRYNLLNYDDRKLSYNFYHNIVDTCIKLIPYDKSFINVLKLFDDLYLIIPNNSRHFKTYIKLFLSLELYLYSNESYYKFGFNLSFKLSNDNYIINKYIPTYIILLARIIKDFFLTLTYDENYKIVNNKIIQFLEGLIETKDKYSLILASRLMNIEFLSIQDSGFEKIINTLLSVDDPIVQSFL